MSRVSRPAFCLGCGKDVGMVIVNSYRFPPDVAHPSWCKADKCKEARANFLKITKEILSGNSR